jgi:hypothetical protein
MKRQKLFFHTVLICAVILSACKQEKKDTNVYLVWGSAIEEANGTYMTERGISYLPYLACEETLYRSKFSLRLDPAAVIEVTIHNSTNTGKLPVGTFDLSAMCEQGIVGLFFPPSPGMVADEMPFESGKVIIAKSGDGYDIDIEAAFVLQNGGGFLKGNFRGIMEEVTPVR